MKRLLTLTLSILLLCSPAIMSAVQIDTMKVASGVNDMTDWTDFGSITGCDNTADLWVGHESTDNLTDGINIRIQCPSSVAYDSIKVRFVCAQTDAGAVVGTWKVEDADNASDFTTCTGVTGRTYWATTASWTLPSVTVEDTIYCPVTVGLATQVNHVIARAGWAANNFINLRLVDNGSAINDQNRVFYSYDTGVGAKVVWVLGYKTVAGGGSTQPNRQRRFGIGSISDQKFCYFRSDIP